MLHFVMPPDGIESSLIEELFRPQAECLRQRGFRVSIVRDEVFRDGNSLRGVLADAIVVYRGWMVRPHEYQHYENAVRAAGAIPLTGADAYRLTHHLPNWYATLSEFTAETVCFDAGVDLVSELARLDWGQYFLKDYVKSLKVDGGSIVRTPKDGARWIQEMLAYRDELEGGICVRRVEDFVPETECRYFVLQGQPHSPDKREIPLPVIAAAERIRSSFFTVDVAKNVAGEWRIVELGDGQVSDLVGWTPERFAEIWPQ